MSLLQDVWARVVGSVPTGATADADGSLSQQMRYVTQNIPTIGVMYKVRNIQRSPNAPSAGHLLLGFTHGGSATPIGITYRFNNSTQGIQVVTNAQGLVWLTYPVEIPTGATNIQKSSGITDVYYISESDLQVIQP